MSTLADNLEIPQQLVEGPKEIFDLKWYPDAHGCLWLRVGRVVGPSGVLEGNHDVALYIRPQPAYSNRGHFEVICEGYWRGDIQEIDHRDMFPRIYMSLETAMEETQKWVAWRMFEYSVDHAVLVQVNAGTYPVHRALDRLHDAATDSEEAADDADGNGEE